MPSADEAKLYICKTLVDVSRVQGKIVVIVDCVLAVLCWLLFGIKALGAA